jgi:hypothetical protein
MSDVRTQIRLQHVGVHALACFFVFTTTLSAATYNVGPNQPLATPNEVPWESLTAGDHIRIHHRPEPYHNKWVICRQGTKDQPIIVEGISGPDGEQPIIDGKNATTRKELNFWSEQRSLIKIGGANRPKDTTPKHIWIKNLEIRNSRPPFTYTGRHTSGTYQFQSAGIFIEKGEHIRISHCTVHNNGNGIMSSWLSRDLVVEHCHIHSNGVEKNGLAHNCYISGIGALFQYNRFGPQRAKCHGVNFKSRAARTILRYNWIEGGKRCVNIVETHTQAVKDAPDYRDTYVYGNIIIRDDQAQGNNIVHYGGDLKDLEWYRRGTLHFYNNTVIANRTRSTSVFLVSTEHETIDARNNIFHAPGYGTGKMGILANGGRIRLHYNWITKGSRNTFSGTPVILEDIANQRGANPGFINLDKNDLYLIQSSACIGAATDPKKKYKVTRQYSLHQSYEKRPHTRDIGAVAYHAKEANQ